MNSTPTCWLLIEPAKSSMTKFSDFAQFWFKPCSGGLDLLGHVLCFLAFYKESKKNHLYSFQFYEVAAKCFDTLAWFIQLLLLRLAGGTPSAPNGEGVDWFRSSYVCMYIAAKTWGSIVDLSNSMKLFVTLFMTLDRFFALMKPLKYKNLNRMKWESAALIVAAIMSILINIYSFFNWDVQKVENSSFYMLVSNKNFTSSDLYAVCGFLRNGVFIAAVIILIGCSAQILVMQKKRNKKAADITLGGNDPRKEKARKATEKILLILTIFKSVQISNEFFMKILYSMLNTFKTGWSSCEAVLLLAIRYVEVTFINSLDFYLMILVNKQFRMMIKKALPTVFVSKCCSGSSVATQSVVSEIRVSSQRTH